MLKKEKLEKKMLEKDRLQNYKGLLGFWFVALSDIYNVFGILIHIPPTPVGSKQHF